MDAVELPDLSEPDTGPFWTAAAQHRLTYQACVNCGTVIFHPRFHCTGCLTGRLEVYESSGRGVVYAFTVVHEAEQQVEGRRSPYVLAYVDLAEGFRMLTWIVDVAVPRVQVGMEVALAWIDADGAALPVFAPHNLAALKGNG